MSITSRFKESKIGIIWLKYENKIVLAAGIIFIAAVSFEAGYLHGQKNKQEPVIVNKVANVQLESNNECASNSEAGSANTGAVKSSATSETSGVTPTDDQKCAYVASKNSNKFHLPTCQFAQKIKPENRVCFSSKEDAIGRGYQGAKCCIK